MKYTIGCVLLIVCMLHVSKACDVCGASSSGQGLGLLPQMNRHFAGIQYQYVELHSRHVPLSELKPVTYSNEYYRTAQLWGRYCIGDRWQLFVFAPYRFNNSTHLQGNSANGVGDISILVNYVLVPNSDSYGVIQHRLQAGTGIKLPTGKYTGISEQDKRGLPNMQPGSGAFDIPFNTNYTLQYRSIGLNTDVSYVLTTAGADGYKYGNKLNVQLNSFYRTKYRSVILLPMVGLRAEHSGHDYDNYTKKWQNQQSGGYILSYVAGMQLYIKQIGVQLQYSRPCAQYYSVGNINAVQRLDTGLMILL